MKILTYNPFKITAHMEVWVGYNITRSVLQKLLNLNNK